MSVRSGLEGIFLDFYGTIAAGDRAAVERTCQRVVADHGLPVSAKDLAVRWGRVFFDAIERHNGTQFRTLTEIEERTLIETLRPMKRSVDPAPYVAELTRYWRQPPLFPEVRDALARCPLPVCCVSNVDSDDLNAACRHHQLQFEFVVTSEDAQSYKPDGAIFRQALARTGWRPERVVHVGDSLHSDVEGAQRAGIRAAWVHREDRILDIGNARPEWTCQDLSLLSDPKFLNNR